MQRLVIFCYLLVLAHSESPIGFDYLISQGNPVPHADCISNVSSTLEKNYFSVQACEDDSFDLVLLHDELDVSFSQAFIPIPFHEGEEIAFHCFPVEAVGSIEQSQFNYECTLSCVIQKGLYLDNVTESYLECGDAQELEGLDFIAPSIEQWGITTEEYPEAALNLVSYCDILNATSGGNITCSEVANCACYAYRTTLVTKPYFASSGLYKTAIPGSSDGVDFVLMKTAYPFQVINVRPNNSTKSSVTYSDGTLYVSFQEKVSSTIIVRKDEWADSYLLTDQFSTINLPSFVLITSGALYVDVKAYGESDTYVFEIVGFHICRMHDCTICWNAVANFHCLHTSQKIWFILFALLFTALFIIACPVFTLLAMCLIPILRKSTCFCWYACKYFPLKFWNRFKPASVPLISQKEESRELSNVEKGMSRIRQRPNILPTVFMVLTFIVASLGCDRGYVSTGTLTDCLREGSTKTCSISTSVDISLNSLNATACILLRDSDTNQEAGTLTVRFKNYFETVTKELMYYTSGYSFSVLEKCYCYPGKHCKGSCSGQIVDNKDFDQPIFPERWINGPGRTHCHRVKQSVWVPVQSQAICPIVFLDPCCYSRFSLNPTHEIYSVHSISKINYHAIVCVKMNHLEEVCTDISKLRSVVPYSSGSVRLDLVSISQTSLSLLSGKSLVQVGNSTWLTEAAPRNAPKSGTVGDIQSATTLGLSQYAQGSFIFDDTSVVLTTTGNHDRYSYSVPGINTLSQTHKLPLVLSGTHWDTDRDNQVIGSPVDPPILSAGLTLTGGFKVTVVSDAVCPKASLLLASGCRNCGSGFVIEIMASSVCAEGNIMVTAVGDDKVTIETVSFRAYTEEKKVRIIGSTTAGDNDFTLVLTGNPSSNKVEIPVKFYAPDFAEVRDPDRKYIDSNSTSTEGPDYSDWWNDFKDWFKNPFGIGWSGFLRYVIYAAVGLVVLFGVYLISTFISPLRGLIKLKNASKNASKQS